VSPEHSELAYISCSWFDHIIRNK